MWILYPLDFPKCCGRFAFEDLFDLKNVFRLSEASKSRDVFVQAVNLGQPGALRVLDEGAAYLPHLLAVIQAIDAPIVPKAAASSRGVKNLRVSWRSFLNTPAQPVFKQFQSVRQALSYELTMVLCTLAAAQIVQAQRGLAEAQMEDIPEGAITSAVSFCAKSAGLFQHAQETTPESLLDQIELVQCPEVYPKVLHGMMAYAQMCTQQLSYEHARRKGSVNHTLLGKIALCVGDLSDKTLAALRSVPEGICGGLVIHLQGCSSLYRAIGWKHIAMAEWEKEAYGVAVTYVKQASAYVAKLRQGLAAAPLPHLRNIVDREVAEVTAVCNEYENDNNNVYFATAPRFSSLVPVHGAFVRGPEKFVDPEPAFTPDMLMEDNKEDPDAAKRGGGLFGLFRKGSGTKP
ncbi:unnamed protein product [Vitrella brassicaformis CCMP3155]|uniref:BRO1 domain-containing protein n=1 Tax=Vitrella brassicaformis (strain CCMP3155) TaxID=1169540 RepID=A0A0G4GU71_VITBC|nr:unnamed protein product [Vitrella brassicaformis CCMP3155]|mmetsp:Transcript_5605/g.13361  ORF Transcript_5605/g.13361 Transcript_5605/m.13361 type:complete len:403 (-) Transcript_5605:808-2016(-)|eukprot:CEM34327.1 unnamed protein product [Vitrella brassicaformis CCMP3155]